ncbi:hypothetical protein niasHS_003955 [Heterodera schachtii]|uniref:Uncharacterized protein n=1 Tax=Heterodera schachtii TaxID=97005 RepID=A0ABD2K3P4_HETSC
MDYGAVPFASPPFSSSSDRAQWGSAWQFILVCIGYAVGLGNLWRFPSLAYEHGGGAFLVPYLTCSFLVGFPLLFLEMSLGQFSRSGPAVVHGRIRPLFQGVGWSMATISLMVSIYYNVIVGWVLIYIWIIVSGRSSDWSSCTNSFNTIYCQSSLEDKRCATEIGASNATEWAFFFNGSCFFGTDKAAQFARKAQFAVLSAVSPAEEFFELYVLEKSERLEDGPGGLNWKAAAALGTAWIVTALVLVKGVKMMGKVAYFTATVPYAIIVVLFLRGISLDGAQLGLDFYLFRPNFSVIFDPATWRAAATHVCFSLSVGFGGILSLSSFNSHSHNCFTDALIITAADGFMSVFGGTAVFSVLGFMAKQLDQPIDQVVQSGTGLAFVAYPEAMSRMPLSSLWSFLFFSMLFILGISSQFGLAEVMCTAVRLSFSLPLTIIRFSLSIFDQFPRVRPHRAKLTVAVCTVLFLAGLCMCTRSGIFYFTIFNDYSASFSLILMLLLEIVLVIYVYGVRNYLADLRLMFGTSRHLLGKIFGPTGYCIRFVWMFLAPFQTLVIFFFVLLTQIGHNLTYGKKKRLYDFPNWAIGVGWLISSLPLLLLPLFVLFNLWKFARKGKSWRELFRLQPKWPSYGRHREENAVEKLKMDDGTTERRPSCHHRPNRIAPAETLAEMNNRSQTGEMPCTRF